MHCTQSTIEQEKYNRLQLYLSSLGSTAIAFSGGADSAFLLRAAYDVLGDNAVAVTVRSALYPYDEFAAAVTFCESQHIRHITADFDALSLSHIAENPPDRCYHCKKAIFCLIGDAAKQSGLSSVCDGSNTDDVCDYRPGMRAIEELGVLSPLRECELSKSDIRILSRQLGLSVWDKPSAACLASRIPYNERITERKLNMIDRAEQIIYHLGFNGCRVRMHGEDLARIEVQPDDKERLLSMSQRVTDELRQIGYAYVCLDMQGYRTGSMNEVI